MNFEDFSGGSVQADQGYFTSRAADAQIASVGSNPTMIDQGTCQQFMHFGVM